MKTKVSFFSPFIVLVYISFLFFFNTSCEQEMVTNDSQEYNIDNQKRNFDTYLDVDPDI